MRYASIDVLRAVAIALMVVVHFMENLSGAQWGPGDAAAPLFTFLAGVSFRTWLLSQQAKGKTEGEISRVAVRRGLFLFGLGFAFNCCVWLPEDTFNWDVLTVIGIALLILALVRGLPVGFLAFLCVVIFTLSPFLRIQSEYATYWTNGFFECDLTLSDIVVGALATAYFPVFPWVVFPLAGYIAGTLVFPDPAERDPSDPSPPSVQPLAAFGIGLILLCVVFVAGRPVWPDLVSTSLLTGWTMFPASVEYVTGMLGICALSFALLHKWIDQQRQLDRYPRLLAVARTMSQYSLSMYLLHHVVHLWPLWITGAVVGADPTHYWRNALPTEASVALAVGCLVGGYWLFRWVALKEWPSIESLMRWLCD